MKVDLQYISDPESNRTFAAKVAAGVVMFVAIVVLVGWIFDIAILKSFLPGFPIMKANTAVAFVIASACIFSLARGRGSAWLDRFAALCGLSIMALAIITLAEYLVGSSLGSDALLVSTHNAPTDQFAGQMSPHSAVNLIFLSISCMFLNGGPLRRKTSEFFAWLMILAGLAATLGYLYKAEHMYGMSPLNGMGIHTIAVFQLCAIALLAINRNSRIVEILTSETLGGIAARRLLPAVVIIPTTVGWLRLLGQEHGLYGVGFGAAISIFCCVVLMFGIVLFFSRTVYGVELRRGRAERDLIRREQRYRDLFDYSQGMVCIHDLAGVISAVNPAALNSLGYAADDVIGRNIREFLPEEFTAEFDAFFRKIEHEGLASGYLPLLSREGEHLIWRFNTILVAEPGEEPYVLSHSQDVTALIEAKEKLKTLSLTDDLTGLYNRRGFLAMAEQQIKLERHSGTARGLTLMFADMDGLKKVNDIHGHEEGSDAIITLSRIISSALRSADLVARWGGDEFVILAIGSQDEDADTMLERIRSRIDDYNETSTKPYLLSCSIGISPLDLNSDKPFESVIAEADEAMYAEKRRRKAARNSTLQQPGISVDGERSGINID